MKFAVAASLLAFLGAQAVIAQDNVKAGDPAPATRPADAPRSPVATAQLGADAPSAKPIEHRAEPTPPSLPDTGGWLAGQWVFHCNVATKETYDDNVYLQDSTKLGHIRSAVTSINPTLELEWKPDNADARGLLSYSPEITAFHAAPHENNTRHLFTGNFSGKCGELTLETNNSIAVVDGPNTGPTYTGPGGAPAIAGFQVRDRRDSAVYRDSLRITWTHDNFFIRPNFSYYQHDWHSKLSASPGYANYVNRSDICGGIDAGWRVADKTYLVAGYRYGHQSQQAYLGNPLEYSNDYQRVLFGIEGQVTPWLKLAAMTGPDFRQYGRHVASTFDRTQTEWYADVSATLTPTSNDELTLLARQYMLPASGGRSIYNDITYSAAYRHKFDEHWSAGLGMRAYGGDFKPVKREDWIFTPSATVVYKQSDRLSVELAWSLDDAESHVPGTSGREYHRQLFTVSARFGL